MRTLVLPASLAFLGLAPLGCVTPYIPKLLARGEMHAQVPYSGGLNFYAEGRKITGFWNGYRGLLPFVSCVPEARGHAQSSRRWAALSLTSFGLSAAAGAGGFIQLISQGGGASWPVVGFGLVVLGGSVLTASARVQATGHAVDAMNFYNDYVGSLGATCADLRYPQTAHVVPSSANLPPSKTLERALKLYDEENYLDAATELYNVTTYQTEDDESNLQRAEFFLGKTLVRLKYNLSSLLYFEKIVKKGPTHRYYGKSLQWLVSLAQLSVDPAGTAALISRYTPQDLEQPALSSARHELYYLLGRYHYQRGNFDRAMELLERVPQTSAEFPRAQLLAAMIDVRAYHARPAVAHLREVLRWARMGSEPGQKSYEHLANLSMGRIYYATHQFALANKYYERVPENSLYRPSSLLESAWTYYRLEATGAARGQLDQLRHELALTSSLESGEALLLRTLITLESCQLTDARLAINEHSRLYAPLLKELTILEQKYTSDGSWFELVDAVRTERSTLSNAAQAYLLAGIHGRPLRTELGYLAELQREFDQLRIAEGKWQAAPLATFMAQNLAKQRSAAVNAVGALAHRYLRDTLEQLQAQQRRRVQLESELTKAEDAARQVPCAKPHP